MSGFDTWWLNLATDNRVRSSEEWARIGYLAGQASVPDIRVQEAALVGENMILHAKVAELERELDKERDAYLTVTERLGKELTALKAQAGEPVYQWRSKNRDFWYDSTKEEAYSRVDAEYEARTLYTTPGTPAAEPVAEVFNSGIKPLSEVPVGTKLYLHPAAEQVEAILAEAMTKPGVQDVARMLNAAPKGDKNE